MNQIVLMGRLTRDPELRHTQSGTPVASFTLAVDRGFTSKDSGERQTDFIDIVAWRGTAEFVSKYFVKGQMAAVTGRLQIRDWTDKDGNKRRSAEVISDNIYFTESKRSRDAAAGSAPEGHGAYSEPKPDYGSGAGSGSGYTTPVASSDFSEIDEDDGDLPF
jgi:single-strand DNA-binding protein